MKELINILFKNGTNLREIRLHLFQIPHKFPRLTQVRKFEGYEDITKEIHKILASEFYTEKKFYDKIILHELGLTSYEDLKKKKKSRYSAKQQKERGGAAWRKRKKEARDRDGNKCVITGDTKPLFVHHVNGDKTDNRLENLLTVSRQVNVAIHYGARDFHPKDLEYWMERDSGYVQKAVVRLELLKQYVNWLQGNGFPDACLESLPLREIATGDWRTGANKDIHISLYKRSVNQNHFWIALLEPTGLSFEKQSFQESYSMRYGQSYSSDPEYEKQKCEDCPHEGDPPCHDFTPGHHCFESSSSPAS